MDNERQWIYDTFERMSYESKSKTRQNGTFVNDYFDGAKVFRVFFFDINANECWRDVYAEDKDDAEAIMTESIADIDIDQIVEKKG